MTNISAEQIVGMNGVQKLLIAWWEIFAAVGLIILAKYLIPIYFINNCTTTPELLEKNTMTKVFVLWFQASFLWVIFSFFCRQYFIPAPLFMVSMFQIKLHLPGLNLL